MHYEVVSRHRKGFHKQYLVVPANDPDDACAAAHEMWDMEERLITRIRKLGDHEVTSEKTERNLLNMTVAFTALAACGLLLIVFLG